MQVHWIKPNPHGTSVGLAEVSGENDKDLDYLRPDLAHLNPKKRMEFLASRLLTQRLCEAQQIPYHGIEKDEYGKPHLIQSNYQLSISHSYPMVACAIHPTAPCGIDIESVRPQLTNIKHKFLNPIELRRCDTNLHQLCIHWSAKEVLYKIHGRKRLTFAKQLVIDEIRGDQIHARILLDDAEKKHLLKYEKVSEYYLVYNV
ncbi:4'-phosphopantetheinyl transferase superfamily protein [Reichenbachiella carrageenanivorans]|uniref:4'-phosphopantetheinyl transferase superfamily protein n=1 Tax=Reichenbachiella carrageenanivorans TaxID=2979869 RepID=A0ABY6CZ40_9BACT|nr:4'-phosphopantetheinyl transferase superfamily protein [Reichenbachiella carrageenanivorans]UXX79182.1 4'-phosphopantetheinyl transferase superfamily protein [Reichenbachiella carrageenanivorans]